MEMTSAGMIEITEDKWNVVPVLMPIKAKLVGKSSGSVRNRCKSHSLPRKLLLTCKRSTHDKIKPRNICNM